MEQEKTKTHWLQSPNKNYLGHWDLPEDGITLTIKSAKWESVTNPVTNQSDAKRVIRFVEDYKPMICNQTNAQSILKATGVKFMEDSNECSISLYTGQTKYMGEFVDCIRIKQQKTTGVKSKNKALIEKIKTLDKEELIALYNGAKNKFSDDVYLLDAWKKRRKELNF